MYQASDVMTDEAEIRAVIPGEFESQTRKILDEIDPLCRAWIEASTFLTMATYDSNGRVDVSPKGDPPGFVKVLDNKTLAIPDRPGNHRFDSFLNILDTGRIGLVFLVPNRNEVVRVNGSALVVRDADVRKQLAVFDKAPDFAIIVRVEEAFYHCGKSIIRSRLWNPERYPDGKALPTYGQALIAHGNLTKPLEDMEAAMKHNDDNRLYDE